MIQAQIAKNTASTCPTVDGHMRRLGATHLMLKTARSTRPPSIGNAGIRLNKPRPRLITSS